METVFDHNPTDKELTRFGNFFEASKRLGIDYTDEKYADQNYYQIGILYLMRKDKEKANEYFARMKNQEYVRTFWKDCP